jgi:D-alanyl-D-alanine endopeptidase (penicillin-binding protein 7)
VCVAACLGTALSFPAAAAAESSAKKTAAPAARKAKSASQRQTRSVVLRRSAPVVPGRPSFGEQAGLHATGDPLALKSSVALVLDQDTDEVLFSKNPQAVLPIASITKLMTALVVTEANQPLDETLTITQDDVDTEKGSRSRLSVGTRLTRGEMMHLALMSSENRAANALGRHYPGGLPAFVAAMNKKAGELGMNDTRYVEPTGLSSGNQSSARDLAALVKAAYAHQILRDLSTSPEHQVAIGNRHLQFRNSNGLVRSQTWDIGLQKTGYISEAGRCLVMQAQLAGRKLIMVLLDSAGKYSRIADAERIRKWVNESQAAAAKPAT